MAGQCLGVINRLPYAHAAWWRVQQCGGVQLSYVLCRLWYYVVPGRYLDKSKSETKQKLKQLAKALAPGLGRRVEAILGDIVCLDDA